MNRKNAIPSTIFIIQLLWIFYLLYEYEMAHPDLPVAFILLHFFAVFSLFVLVFSWFLYFKAKEKLMIWKLIIGISSATVITLAAIYVWMMFDKY